MNSTLKTFVTILLTAGAVGFATYTYVDKSGETTAYEDENVVDPIEVLETQEVDETISNSAVNSVKDSKLNFEFQLPEGYGALKDVEGEGTLQIKYYLGKFAPEIGENVILSSLSIADYIKVIPSYDPEIVTLENWREKGNVYDGLGASETETIEIAGLTATVSYIPGMWTECLIQFVKDNNYYEIRTEGDLEGEAITKIIETFSFTN